MIKLEKVNKYFNRRRRNEIHIINNTSLELEEWFNEWLWNYKRFKAGGTFKGYVSKTKNHIIKNI